MCKICVELYTVDDLQRIFSCSRSTVYKLIKSPGFPSFKANGRRYVRPRDLDWWIERRMKNSII